MRLATIKDVDFINALANDPANYRWVKGELDGKVDVSSLFLSGRAFGLIGEFGAIVFVRLSEGVYEPHALFPKGENRAARALADGRAALGRLFTDPTFPYTVNQLCAIIPDSSAGTVKLAKALGFRSDMSYEKECPWASDHETRFILTRQRFYSFTGLPICAILEEN